MQNFKGQWSTWMSCMKSTERERLCEHCSASATLHVLKYPNRPTDVRWNIALWECFVQSLPLSLSLHPSLYSMYLFLSLSLSLSISLSLPRYSSLYLTPLSLRHFHPISFLPLFSFLSLLLISRSFGSGVMWVDSGLLALTAALREGTQPRHITIADS